MKAPKLPKIGSLNIGVPKIGAPKISMPKIKLLLIVLLIALAAVGLGYAKGILFKDTVPQKTEESVNEDQEKESDDIDMAGLENHLGTDFLRMLKSEAYMIRYRTTTEYNGESFEVETTYAVKGGSIAMTSGDRATVVKGGKVFMLDHTNKRILSWDVTKSDDLRRIATDELVYVGSSDTGGLVCEEYSTGAAQIKLYFEGEKLVRIATALNKMDVVMDVIEVSQKVPDSLFQVPADYMTTVID